MSLLRSLIPLLIVGGCYQEYQPATTPQPYFQPQPVVVQGPPGGGMDPESTYVEGAAGGAAATVDVTATVTDAEIDATLEGYGEWVEDEEYGRIWRPSTTVVGVDFTPYETCGTWIWTDDYGWTFSCDYNWGWLPFHYGYWGWFDDYWAWVPDYTWSPAWVEWRSGGGYVGWRPIGPRIRDHRDYRDPDRGPIVRDHRNPDSRGPIIRDHRGIRTGDADWRFVADRDLGRRIRPTLVRNNAEGIRATSIVSRPSMGPSPHARAHVARAADLMQNRLTARNQVNGGSVGTVSPSRPTYTQPTRPYRPRPSTYAPSRPSYSNQPTYQQPPTYVNPSRPAYEPSRPTYTPSRPTYTPSTPSRPTYTPSRPTYTPSTPSRPTYTPSRPSYTPSTPSRPSFTPSAPSRPTYTPSAPSRSWSSSSPSRASSSSSSAPSRASSSSSSSGGRSSGGSRRR